jgi:hypothetical protein
LIDISGSIDTKIEGLQILDSPARRLVLVRNNAERRGFLLDKSLGIGLAEGFRILKGKGKI